MRPILALALLLAAALAPAAQALPIVYTASLSGPNESPPVASPGTGVSTVTLDLTANTLRIKFSFIGLVGTSTVAHIHGPTLVPGEGNASVMTATPSFPGFPVGVTAGAYDMTFDTLAAATWRPGFITASGGTVEGAEAAFAAALASGSAYLNIHSSFSPSGEIRGFYAPVPIPGAAGLLALGLGGLALMRRRV